MQTSIKTTTAKPRRLYGCDRCGNPGPARIYADRFSGTAYDRNGWATPDSNTALCPACVGEWIADLYRHKRAETVSLWRKEKGNATRNDLDRIQFGSWARNDAARLLRDWPGHPWSKALEDLASPHRPLPSDQRPEPKREQGSLFSDVA